MIKMYIFVSSHTQKKQINEYKDLFLSLVNMNEIEIYRHKTWK